MICESLVKDSELEMRIQPSQHLSSSLRKEPKQKTPFNLYPSSLFMETVRWIEAIKFEEICYKAIEN